jgi:hypothetical protein
MSHINKIKYSFLIYVHPITTNQFQIAMSFLSLKNLLKRRSRSASCVRKLPEY